MESVTQKCVIVIAEGLPMGPSVNIASILSFSFGRQLGTVIGPDVSDASGMSHAGIITIPLPILMASQEKLKQVRLRAAAEHLVVVDFTATAQQARTYQEYANALAAQTASDLTYLGIALCGDKKIVNKLTGNFALLREVSLKDDVGVNIKTPI